MDELEKRVQQFNSLSLPGQGVSMHMGTSYLVNDLWREVQRLRKVIAAQQKTHTTLLESVPIIDDEGELVGTKSVEFSG